MANTNITFQDVDDYLVPSVSSVSVVGGDTITFIAPESTASKLCIPSGTAAILSPTPDGSNTLIAAGSSVTFTFTSSATGTYCVLLQKQSYACPTSITCPSGSSGTLGIYAAGPIDFEGEDRTWP